MLDLDALHACVLGMSYARSDVGVNQERYDHREEVCVIVFAAELLREGLTIDRARKESPDLDADKLIATVELIEDLKRNWDGYIALFPSSRARAPNNYQKFVWWLRGNINPTDFDSPRTKDAYRRMIGAIADNQRVLREFDAWLTRDRSAFLELGGLFVPVRFESLDGELQKAESDYREMQEEETRIASFAAGQLPTTVLPHLNFTTLTDVRTAVVNGIKKGPYEQDVEFTKNFTKDNPSPERCLLAAYTRAVFAPLDRLRLELQGLPIELDVKLSSFDFCRTAKDRSKRFYLPILVLGEHEDFTVCGRVLNQRDFCDQLLRAEADCSESQVSLSPWSAIAWEDVECLEGQGRLIVSERTSSTNRARVSFSFGYGKIESITNVTLPRTTQEASEASLRMLVDGVICKAIPVERQQAPPAFEFDPGEKGETDDRDARRLVNELEFSTPGSSSGPISTRMKDHLAIDVLREFTRLASPLPVEAAITANVSADDPIATQVSCPAALYTADEPVPFDIQAGSADHPCTMQVRLTRYFSNETGSQIVLEAAATQQLEVHGRRRGYFRNLQPGWYSYAACPADARPEDTPPTVAFRVYSDPRVVIASRRNVSIK